MARSASLSLVHAPYNVWIESVVDARDVFCFVLVVSPLTSPYDFYCVLKKALQLRRFTLISISLRDYTMHELKKILSAGFLGESFFYWIRDLEHVSKHELNEFLVYCTVYKGPHTIIVILGSDAPLLSTWRGQRVEFPDELSKVEVHTFYAIWYNQKTLFKNWEHFFLKHKKIMFHHFLSIMPYIPLLSRSFIADFETKYIPRLFVTDSVSLFSFIDLFWQKNIIAFYKQWHELKLLYGYQFWITFWSEQFFRGYFYIECMSNGLISVAQQIATRKLTFFYTKNGWRSVNKHKLQELHYMVYTFDYASKTGSTCEMLECAYVKWFTE